MGHLLTNADPQFYAVMGPFLSKREIVKELGFSVWDDDGKAWIVARVDGAVAGFCGVLVGKGIAQVTSFYVLPAYRKQGIGAGLLQDALEYAAGVGCTMARATAAPDSQALFVAAGFDVIGEVGRYSKMEKRLS